MIIPLQIVPHTPQWPGVPLALKNSRTHAPVLAHLEILQPLGKEGLEIVIAFLNPSPNAFIAVVHSVAVVMLVYCGGQSLANLNMYPIKS